ncbi:MAG: 4Fe-4S dicluster domain-containing protein [Actinobacteria bacterium]|nr:4Fe-4S dicluster domain-containing protein [Actinomycetota bacterium]
MSELIDENKEQVTENNGMSRRQFMTGVGGVGVGVVLGGMVTTGVLGKDDIYAIAASDGYLLVDSKKCSGCMSCMLACSLMHHGQTNLSLSRIQIVQDSTEAYPNDLHIYQCHQCPFPSCVEACPTGAMHADPKTGVRTVDDEKCIGCERCINACPYTPSRVQWNPIDKHAQKCDLCTNTPNWNNKEEGMLACVEACSTRALELTKEIPMQTGLGYDVDLGHTSVAWQTFGIISE